MTLFKKCLIAIYFIAKFQLISSNQQSTIDLDFGVNGFRIEEYRNDISYTDDGIPEIPVHTPVKIRLFGDNFDNHTQIRFVSDPAEKGSECKDYTYTASRDFWLDVDSVKGDSASLIVTLPAIYPEYEYFYICIRDNGTVSKPEWIHQGTDKWVTILTASPLMTIIPMWVKVILIIFLLGLSGLFSGLILGLLSISKMELKILISTGDDDEKKYAKTIQPVRERGSYLLCSLALGNVMVTVVLTLLLNNLTSGLVALLGTTFGILIFGELIPQAYCSRHGLLVGAKTIWITKFFMLITFPLSCPFSFILDKVLGQDIGNVYSRDRFKEILRVTRNDLRDDEVNIISGALDMKTKMVGDIMTPITEVYMLPDDSVLDFDTIREIMEKGFSRIPVYRGFRTNIVALLHAKDLAFVDPDDKMPLKTICDFYKNTLTFVPQSRTLDILFKDFKTGNKGHMAFVTSGNDGNDEERGMEMGSDVIGLVTIEDVIETLIQEEINDEADVWVARSRRKSRAANLFRFPKISRDSTNSEITPTVQVSQQLAWAAYQYLSTSVELFNSSFISQTILQRLLKQNLFDKIKVKTSDPFENAKALLYERGKPSDYFILILEGRVQVEVGRENLLFESGPFTFFGNQSLIPSIGTSEGTSNRRLSIQSTATRKISSQASFIPDYTVRAISDLTFVKVPRDVYMAARQATLLEKTSLGQGGDDGKDKEVQISLNPTFTIAEQDNINEVPKRIIKRKAGVVEFSIPEQNGTINEGFVYEGNKTEDNIKL